MAYIRITVGSSRSLSEDGTEEVERDVEVVFSVKFLRKFQRYFKGAPLGVFLCIAQHMDHTGWSRPSVQLIKEETGYSDNNTISNAITELENIRIESHRVLIVVQRRTKTGQFVRNEYLVLPTKREETDYEDGKFADKPAVKLTTKPYRENPSTEGEPYRGLPYTVNQTGSITDDLSIDSNVRTIIKNASGVSENDLARESLRQLVNTLKTTGLDLSLLLARRLASDIIAVCAYGYSKGDKATSILANDLIKDQLGKTPSIAEIATFAAELWDMYEWWPTSHSAEYAAPQKKPSIANGLRTFRNIPKEERREAHAAEQVSMVEWGESSDGTRRPLKAGELPSKFVKTWFAPASKE